MTRTLRSREVWLTCFSALAVITLLTPLSIVANAQSATDGITPTALAPGAPAGSYSLSDFENINAFTGNLNVRFLLMSIGGRGGAGYTMMLPVEQHWRTGHSETMDSLGNIHYNTYADPNWWEGLKPGYGPGVLQARFESAFPLQCDPILVAHGTVAPSHD